MVAGISVNSFVTEGGGADWVEDPAILRVHQPQYRFMRTIRYSGKYISISSEASLQQTHNAHKDNQQRRRDP